MENEKNESAYDSHEQELQQTDEIQRHSTEVLTLVQGDDDPPNSKELKSEPARAPASSKSGSSDSLKIQEDQELNVQPPTRTKSAPEQVLQNRARPGAYYAAPGTTQLVAAAEEADLEEPGRDTISVSEGILVSAVKVEAGAEEQRFRRMIFEEALQVDVVESVAEAPLEKHDNRKWRKLSVYLLVACGVLAILGLSVGLTRNNDGSGEDGTPTATPTEPIAPPEPFIPTLEAIRQRGVLRCGGLDTFYYVRYDPVTNEKVGFDIDLVSSLFICFCPVCWSLIFSHNR